MLDDYYSFSKFVERRNSSSFAETGTIKTDVLALALSQTHSPVCIVRTTQKTASSWVFSFPKDMTLLLAVQITHFYGRANKEKVRMMSKTNENKITLLANHFEFHGTSKVCSVRIGHGKHKR